MLDKASETSQVASGPKLVMIMQLSDGAFQVIPPIDKSLPASEFKSPIRTKGREQAESVALDLLFQDMEPAEAEDNKKRRNFLDVEVIRKGGQNIDIINYVDSVSLTPDISQLITALSAATGLPAERLRRFIEEEMARAGFSQTKRRRVFFLNPKLDVNDLKLSPKQVDSVVQDSTLGRLHRRYEELVGTIDLPAGGFETKEQAQAAGRLSTTYQNLVKRRTELGLEPLPKDSRVTEARRLTEAFYRRMRRNQPTREPLRRGRPVKTPRTE